MLLWQFNFFWNIFREIFGALHLWCFDCLKAVTFYSTRGSRPLQKSKGKSRSQRSGWPITGLDHWSFRLRDDHTSVNASRSVKDLSLFQTSIPILLKHIGYLNLVFPHCIYQNRPTCFMEETFRLPRNLVYFFLNVHQEVYLQEILEIQ